MNAIAALLAFCQTDLYFDWQAQIRFGIIEYDSWATNFEYDSWRSK